MTFEQNEAAGVEVFLREIRELQVGTYRADSVRCVEIPKPDGRSTRPLGIPSIRTRVIQEAALVILTPIFEADLPDNAWGNRPKRSAVGAAKRVHGYLKARTGNVIPEIAVDPNSGKLYAVWQDGRFSGFAHDDIAFSASTDGGSTWTVPVRVNQTPNNAAAFTPSVYTGADGTIAVTNYDFRNATPDPTTLPTDGSCSAPRL